MSDIEYVPAADVLNGIEIAPLPEGWMVLEAVVIVKGLDEDGDPLWCTRYTQGLTRTELLGILTGAQALAKNDFLEMYQVDDD